MYGTRMPDMFILLDTLEYSTIRVPTRFDSIAKLNHVYVYGVVQYHTCYGEVELN